MMPSAVEDRHPDHPTPDGASVAITDSLQLARPQETGLAVLLGLVLRWLHTRSTSVALGLFGKRETQADDLNWPERTPSPGMLAASQQQGQPRCMPRSW